MLNTAHNLACWKAQKRARSVFSGWHENGRVAGSQQAHSRLVARNTAALAGPAWCAPDKPSGLHSLKVRVLARSVGARKARPAWRPRRPPPPSPGSGGWGGSAAAARSIAIHCRAGQGRARRRAWGSWWREEAGGRARHCWQGWHSGSREGTPSRVTAHGVG
jgi:hypothetical protein